MISEKSAKVYGPSTLSLHDIITGGWHHQVETLGAVSLISISLMLQLNTKPIKTSRSLLCLAAAQPVSEAFIDTLRCRLFSSLTPLLHMRCHCWSVKKTLHQKTQSWIAFASYWEWVRPSMYSSRTDTESRELSSEPGSGEEKWQPAPAN